MRLAFALASFLAICLAAPPRTSHHVVHETRAVDPVDWRIVRRLEHDKVLPMRFGLRQRNLDRIEEMLMAVSHPESPTYGQHWTPSDVVKTFAPSGDTIAAVANWLADAGIARERLRLSVSKGWIDLNATVGEIEDLLKTEYHVYSHSETGDEQIGAFLFLRFIQLLVRRVEGCASYSVPAHVQPHVDLIKPTVHFQHRPVSSRFNKRGLNLGAPSLTRGPKLSNKKIEKTLSLATCDEAITLDCLRALYSVDYTPVATDRNSYGIGGVNVHLLPRSPVTHISPVEFTPQAFLQGDLDLFFRNFSPSLVGVKPNTVLIDGAIVQTTNQSFNFNGESDLDLEYAMGLTNPQPITLLQTGDIVEGAGFDNWLDAVDGSFCTFEGGDDPTQSCGIIAPPNVVSVSYGQDESTITAASAMRQCQEYAKLGLMGTSVFYSSGDDGVAGNGGVCLNSELQPVRRGTVFNPGFPVTCPFVTAVGATQVNPGSTVNDPEGACEQVIFSGGGFSNIFPMPSYQADAVTEFLTNHPPPYTHGEFNNSGTELMETSHSSSGRLVHHLWSVH
ncbi:hypothetical protein C0995_000350 [Termitomyces sp. Mi166|nr:hypothetical protein C0995_000350 [Termitomyces sp. Mi166\